MFQSTDDEGGIPKLRHPSIPKLKLGHRRTVSFDQPVHSNTDSPKPDTVSSRKITFKDDIGRPSLEVIRTTQKKVASGAQTVGRLLKKSRKLILPYDEEDEEIEYHKDSKYFNTKGKNAINSSLLLLLLLMTRIGPALMSGNNVIRLYGDVLLVITSLTYEQLNSYISYTYYSCLCFTLLMTLFARMFISFLLPSLGQLRKKIEGINKTIIQLFDYGIQQFRYPTILFVIVLFIMMVCQLIFIFGIYQSNMYMIIVSRCIFGLCDALVLVFQVTFVIRTFPKKNFSLCLSFIISVESLINSAMSFISDIQSMNTFLWTAFAFFCFGWCCIMSIKAFDQSDSNIFKVKKETTERVEIKKRIFASTSLFTLFHTCIMFVFFSGLYMFPFYFGGYVWNYHVNDNSADLQSLLFLQQLISSSRALVSPAIGAWLDKEISPIEDWKTKSGLDTIFNIATKYYRHIGGMLFGMTGSLICNFGIYYGQVVPDSSSFYFVSLFYGVCLAFLLSSLWSFPMILIVNVTKNHRHDYFSIFISLMFFVTHTCKFIVGSFVDTESVMEIVWLICTIFSILFVVVMMFLCLSGWIKYVYDTKFKTINDPNLQFKVDDTEEVPQNDLLSPRSNINTPSTPRSSNASPPVSKLSYWSLLYVLPLEILLFLFSIILIAIYSGAFSLVLHFWFSTSENFKWIKAFYLPLLFVLCIISLRIGFPKFFKRIVSIIFFQNTRKIFGLNMQGTIAEKINVNPNFTIAANSLKGNAKLWKALSTNKLEKKPALFVIPDEVFLKNEEDRWILRELESNPNLKDLDVEICGNGMIIVNEKLIKEKNLYDYHVHRKDTYLLTKYQGALFNLRELNLHFHMYVFLGYCIFSIIPNIYRVAQKLITPTSNVSLFEDGIASLIRIINFICGYFIFIPFVSLWQDTSRFLEKISDYVMIFKDDTTKTLKFLKDTPESITVDTLRKWDLQFKHLNNVISNKVEFIKYIYMFGMLFAKFTTIGFSLVALFVRFGVSNEIIQIVVLVMLMEVAVLKYLIQPAALISADLNRIAMSCNDLYHEYHRNMNDKNAKRSQETVEKMKEVAEYWSELTRHWTLQVQTGWLGFFLKSKTLNLSYPIAASNFRSWIETSLYSLLPSIAIYFLKQFQ